MPMTACQTSSSGTEATFCGAAKAIYYSKNDTAPTKEQVREHNAVGKALCTWGAKK